MRSDIIGLINLRDSSPLREMNERRPLSAVPICSKFRLIDFTLSSMVNAGIGNVGLLLGPEARALMDHIRSAKEWNLARKQDGLFYLPSDVEDIIHPSKGDIRDYYKNLRFVERGDSHYLLLSSCDMIHNIDYEKVLHFHRQHNADVTLIYHKQINALIGKGRVIETAKNGRITSMSELKDTNPGDNLFLQAMLIDSEIFLKSVRFAYAKGDTSFFDDVIGKNLDHLRVFGYQYDGYAIRIDSVQSYFQANMDLLNVDNMRNVFRTDKPIYTKVMDEPPTRYLEGSKVTNSLIANGCVIEGKVENSILFRRVRIGRNAVIKNSIILQHSTIGEDAQLDGVVCDKNAIIQPEAILNGSADSPLCIAKFAVR